MHDKLTYPVYPGKAGLVERMFVKAGYGAAYCNVCGNLTVLVIRGDNLRETCECIICKSINRQRQLAMVICGAFSTRKRRISSLREFAKLGGIMIYNTEASGPIHNQLKKADSYSSSEYFGPGYRSGEIINDVVHQDLTSLFCADESFDLVVSADVFEHIPDPYKAFREVFRVVKPGGRHIFTVPFHSMDFIDEVRATVDESGRDVFLKEPQYHSDPLRPKGVLVYRIFSLQMLVELARIGFRTNMYNLCKPSYGIYGNGIVFESVRS